MEHMLHPGSGKLSKPAHLSVTTFKHPHWPRGSAEGRWDQITAAREGRRQRRRVSELPVWAWCSPGDLVSRRLRWGRDAPADPERRQEEEDSYGDTLMCGVWRKQTEDKVLTSSPGSPRGPTGPVIPEGPGSPCSENKRTPQKTRTS